MSAVQFHFNVKQINHGYSRKKNTLRGIHFQEHPQERLDMMILILFGRMGFQSIYMPAPISKSNYNRVMIDYINDIVIKLN